MKKTISILFILIVGIFVFSNPTVNKPWNYSFNPALLDFGTRNFIDIGGNVDLDLIQPFFNFGDLFKEDVIIDFNEIYNNLDGKNLNILLDANGSAYGKIYLWFLTYAKTINISSKTKISIPNDLIKFISEGNVVDGELINLAGNDGIFNSDIIFESNNYISLQTKNSIFGISLSNFYPIALLRSNISFESINDIENAKTNIKYSISGNIYSSMQSFEAINTKLNPNYTFDNGGKGLYEDFMNALDNFSGLKINVGYINKKGKWGVSLNDIVIKPAEVKYQYTFDATGAIEIENMEVLTDIATPIIKLYDDFSNRIFPEISGDLPMNVSFFYTLPIIFNPTPHIQYYFDRGLSWV
ncbi:hypothetical protein [Marinitoga lauensis]|uniref:hypothetical protein n=1 Tax=Marinitoga lauensis TaxID=2201189 RepID=UPI001012F9F4|nr:hypothetical protein [Marinitoga lauensis]